MAGTKNQTLKREWKTLSRGPQCQKYKFSPIFVKKLEIRLSPDFLRIQTCLFVPQICKLGTQTQIVRSEISSNISLL